MKKILSLILALVLVFAVAACAQEPAPATPVTPADPAPVDPAPADPTPADPAPVPEPAPGFEVPENWKIAIVTNTMDQN